MDLDDEELYYTRKQKGLIKEEECLHCGKGKAAYCEECYQELIAENAKMQEKIKKCESTGSKLINKEKVKEILENIEYYFYRMNVLEEDIEYIREIKKELLGE